MSKNVIIGGMSYSGVSNLSLETDTGNNALFSDTSECTANRNHILQDKTTYFDGEMITGTIPSQNETGISINGNTLNVENGYYNGVQKQINVVYFMNSEPDNTVGIEGDLWVVKG